MGEKELLFPGKSSINVYGGGLAAVHSVGALKFLVPRSKITFAEGVSAGAIIAAVTISHDFNIDKLISIWHEIDRTGAEAIFTTGNPIAMRSWWGKSLYTGEGLAKLIDKYIDAEKLINWENEFIVVVNNMTNGKKIGLSNKDERFVKNPKLFKMAIQASSSLGGLLPPILMDGEWHRDGHTCSIVASIEREIDNIFVILSQGFNEGAGEHHENDKWYDQMISNTRESVRDKVIADIKHAKRSGYRIIEQNPTGLFDDVKVDSRIQIKNFVKDTVDALNPLSSEPIAERLIGQRTLIVFTPVNPVQTLKTDRFGKGDMSIAIDRTIKEVEGFVENRLVKEL